MDKIAIGKVRTSTGVRGYFKVLSFSGESDHFKKLKGQTVEIRLNGKTRFLVIEDVRMNGMNLTIKASGIDNPEDAKKLSGWEFYVERDKAVKLDKGEYYLADLCRCSLVMDSEIIGKIKGVSSNGISDMLEVEVNEKTRLIPFMEIYVGNVDLENLTVELKEGWLLE
jgi:16S rRNA processing protein RimM